MSDVNTSEYAEEGNELNKGGRPKGSTTVSKSDIKEKIELAKNKIASLYKASKDKHVGRLKTGTYKTTIHNSVFHKLGILANNETSIQEQLEC